jgi:hypothetical protein
MKNISIQLIKKRASDLLDIDPSDISHVNIEYTRAICELIADIDGNIDVPLDVRSKEIAIELGIPKDIAIKIW